VNPTSYANKDALGSVAVVGWRIEEACAVVRNSAADPTRKLKGIYSPNLAKVAH
jgi:hypothetical protein